MNDKSTTTVENFSPILDNLLTEFQNNENPKITYGKTPLSFAFLNCWLNHLDFNNSNLAFSKLI